MKKIIILTALFIFIKNSNAQCWKLKSTGRMHSLMLRTDSTLWGCGDNTYAQLGIGNYITPNIPIQIDANTNWKYVLAFEDKSFAIKFDGTLWAWGRSGSLGVGGGTYVTLPTQVGIDTDWKNVSAGIEHTLGLKTNGTLWAWGSNFWGQLGDTTFQGTSRDIPTQIGIDTDWASISAGVNHSMALKSNGTLWTWGANYNNQLGSDTLVSKRKYLLQIITDTDWKYIEAGYDHSMALKNNGSLWAWSDNNSGELGNGVWPPKPIRTPKMIGSDYDWLSVSGGKHYSLAIKTDSSLWSWGDNISGQLGIGTSSLPTFIPQKISNMNNWKSIEAGYYSSVSINNVNDIYAWGANYAGKLGDGTVVDKSVPTLLNCNVVGIKENQILQNIQIYPNPVNTILSIVDEQNQLVKSTLEISNYLGQNVLLIPFEQRINISSLVSGFYTIKIKNSKGLIFTAKFIKQE